MGVSRNRKGHAKKSAARTVRVKAEDKKIRAKMMEHLIQNYQNNMQSTVEEQAVENVDVDGVEVKDAASVEVEAVEVEI